MQIGSYSLRQRLATVLYRGAQFFAVGFLSSAVGHSLTKWGVGSLLFLPSHLPESILFQALLAILHICKSSLASELHYQGGYSFGRPRKGPARAVTARSSHHHCRNSNSDIHYAVFEDLRCVCRCSTSAMQVEQRQLANPKKDGEEPYKPLAPVLDNSIAWGAFVAASTNIRYQLVNGIEERGLVRSSPPCSADHASCQGCHHILGNEFTAFQGLILLKS